MFLAAAAISISAPAADPSGSPPNNPATAQELPQITVIGNTPLGGLGLPLNQIPSNVQTADSQDMQRQQT
jgi:iron complex outermembrane receptor protein